MVRPTVPLCVVTLAMVILSTASFAQEPASPSPAIEAAASSETDAEALITAAQSGDVERVRELLDRGVDVNSKSRYGATALSFAVFRGNEALAMLLLERGADVDATDRFYGFTPLSMATVEAATSEPHRRILLALLERKPTDPDPGLMFGVQHADLEVIGAALDAGVSTRGFRAALAQAESRGVERIVSLLRDRAPEEADGTGIELTPEQLVSYEGDYRNEQLEMSIKIFVEGDALELQVQGQPAITLGAVEQDAFESIDLPGVEVAFSGRAGTKERFELTQGGQSYVFGRIDGSAMALTSPAPEGTAEPTAAVERSDMDRASAPAERTEARPWPSFRGPNASGIADGQGVPTTWNAETGENLLWKVPVPGMALASPVIWGDRVFVATAVSEQADGTFRTGLYGDVDSIDDDSVHRWIVQARSLHTGELIWERTASEGRPKVKRHLKSSHANPTPVTDGEHVVVNFGSEGLFCYTSEGELLWQRDLGVLSSGWFYDPTFEWGFSSSPILYRGRVIVQVDIQKDSFLAAFDVSEGTELWRTARDEIPTWGTPSVLETESGAEIVTNGTTVRGYDATTGEELWRLGPNSEVTVATPVIADGRAYVTANYPPVRPIYVLAPGGRGDLSLDEGESSNEKVVWSTRRGGVYIPTPIVYRGIYYALQMNGRLTAYDAATGEEIYRQRIGSADSFAASTVAADGKLFFTTEQGTTYVVRAGREFELLATNRLDEVVMASPAISDGVLVIRGLEHLYGLGVDGRGESEEP